MHGVLVSVSAIVYTRILVSDRIGACPYCPFSSFDLGLSLVDPLLPISVLYGSNSTWLDSTRHIRRVEPMHFGCVELVEEHSTRSTRRARLARHDELD